MGLTEVYEKLAAADKVIETQHDEEMSKLGEEDAAGRIMARGFADELDSLTKKAGGDPPLVKKDTFGTSVKGSAPPVQAKVGPGLSNRRGTIGGNRSAFAPPPATPAPAPKPRPGRLAPNKDTDIKIDS